MQYECNFLILFQTGPPEALCPSPVMQMTSVFSRDVYLNNTLCAGLVLFQEENFVKLINCTAYALLILSGSFSHIGIHLRVQDQT